MQVAVKDTHLRHWISGEMWIRTKDASMFISRSYLGFVNLSKNHMCKAVWRKDLRCILPWVKAMTMIAWSRFSQAIVIMLLCFRIKVPLSLCKLTCWFFLLHIISCRFIANIMTKDHSSVKCCFQYMTGHWNLLILCPQFSGKNTEYWSRTSYIHTYDGDYSPIL